MSSRRSGDPLVSFCSLVNPGQQGLFSVLFYVHISFQFLWSFLFPLGSNFLCQWQGGFRSSHCFLYRGEGSNISSFFLERKVHVFPLVFVFDFSFSIRFLRTENSLVDGSFLSGIFLTVMKANGSTELLPLK